MQRPKRSCLRLIGIYGVGHFLVDASCAALVFSASAAGRLPLSIAMVAVLTYNLLAFASQPILGWFVNDTSSAHVWARAGALTTALAYAASQMSAGIWPAVLLAGLGNAAFHVGGGVLALRVEPGRAAAPGLFVAPGAAGLAAGIWMGGHQWYAWFPALALALAIPFLSGLPEVASRRPLDGRSPPTALLVAAVGVLFAVVAMRAFVGSGIVLPWKSEPGLLVALTAAVVIGKGAGGVLADRFGRLAIGGGALVLSAPFLMIAPTSATAGVAGMLLFNMTMPVTLVAVADLFPERPGFAFGLTCLALIAGALPVMLHLVRTIAPVPVVLWVLGSAALLWYGLTWRDRDEAASAPFRPDPEEV